ncbi:LacI family transcriptional regulator, partial [Limimaricola sp. ASW11-118]
MSPKPPRGAAIRMADVARAVGVSAMTVSRAFKGDDSVRPETRDRILRKAEELGYVFDATAANLRQSRTGFVAVTVPALNSANFAETVRALTEGLAREGARLTLISSKVLAGVSGLNGLFVSSW